ncbi:hypothetical protein PLICRDRAFT_94688 [Plicaturopsis crispa FD-325 SS-3]|uniref:Unplaced genomic scaffold PLICRscaffold_15, whole genome shotgun sequence n=1 Tax=Plicaturopsis crispa FD-325 SS-3 TaxID=944288 RepID=A0A0C9SL98_PLICR|nr:hypothetical protein PLICRDRAFT_94688 [Plicaturopsis crispa FD-325 SS-3]
MPADDDESDAELRNGRAPFLALPPEIISLIFVAGLNLLNSPNDKRSFLLAISQTTRRLRGIAIATSSLWMVVPAPVFPEWLARSNGRPIDVTVNLHSLGSPNSTMCIVCPHASRWRFLDLHLPFSPKDETLLSLAYTYVPLLERLRIRMNHGNNDVWRDVLAGYLAGSQPTPSLKELHLSGLVILHSVAPALETFHFQIQERSYGLQGQIFCNMLSQYPSLTTLVLEGAVCLNPSSIVILPSLATLVVKCAARTMHTYFVELLLHLDAPALHTLILDFTASSANMLVEIPTSGGRTIFPNLKTLHLECTVSRDAVFLLMLLFPGITSLVLARYTSDMLATAMSHESMYHYQPIPPWCHLRRVALNPLHHPESVDSTKSLSEIENDILQWIHDARFARSPHIKLLQVHTDIAAQARCNVIEGWFNDLRVEVADIHAEYRQIMRGGF